LVDFETETETDVSAFEDLGVEDIFLVDFAKHEHFLPRFQRTSWKLN
jgi:hypothetical protein